MHTASADFDVLGAHAVEEIDEIYGSGLEHLAERVLRFKDVINQEFESDEVISKSYTSLPHDKHLEKRGLNLPSLESTATSEVRLYSSVSNSISNQLTSLQKLPDVEVLLKHIESQMLAQIKRKLTCALDAPMNSRDGILQLLQNIPISSSKTSLDSEKSTNMMIISENLMTMLLTQRLSGFEVSPTLSSCFLDAFTQIKRNMNQLTTQIEFLCPSSPNISSRPPAQIRRLEKRRPNKNIIGGD